MARRPRLEVAAGRGLTGNRMHSAVRRPITLAIEGNGNAGWRRRAPLRKLLQIVVKTQYFRYKTGGKIKEMPAINTEKDGKNPKK